MSRILIGSSSTRLKYPIFVKISNHRDSPEICKGVDDDSKDKVEDDDDDNEEEEDVVENPDHEEGVFAGRLTQNVTNPSSIPQTLKLYCKTLNAK